MKCVMVYWSRYGNGKKLIEFLAEKLKEKQAETQILKTQEADPKALPAADMYVFSAPAEAFNLQRNMRTFMKNLNGMDGKKYAIINTHAMKRNWLSKMEKLLSKKNMLKVAEIDFQVQGDGMKTGDGLMQGWEEKLSEFASKL